MLRTIVSYIVIDLNAPRLFAAVRKICGTHSPNPILPTEKILRTSFLLPVRDLNKPRPWSRSSGKLT